MPGRVQAFGDSRVRKAASGFWVGNLELVKVVGQVILYRPFADEQFLCDFFIETSLTISFSGALKELGAGYDIIINLAASGRRLESQRRMAFFVIE